MKHTANDSATDGIRSASLRILKETGVHIGSQRALDIFENAGIPVDRTRGRVLLRETDIEKALETTPAAFRVFGRDTENPLCFGTGKSYFLSGGASLRVLNLDGSYVPSTWEHLKQFNTLLDKLENVHMCINQVDPANAEQNNLYIRLGAAGQTHLGFKQDFFHIGLIPSG
jgi:trimethylamine:corrinoid methyltransferase-like protein